MIQKRLLSRVMSLIAGMCLISGIIYSLEIPSAALQTRILQIPGATITRGQNGNITIQYVAVGDEAGVGLSISFDTSQLTFVSISPGAGVGSFIPNTSQAASGQIGFLATTQIGQTFPAGTT